jgi:hypothetical protein
MEIIHFYVSASFTPEKAQTLSKKAFQTIYNVVNRFPYQDDASINVKIPTNANGAGISYS